MNIERMAAKADDIKLFQNMVQFIVGVVCLGVWVFVDGVGVVYVGSLIPLLVVVAVIVSIKEKKAKG